MKTLFIILLSLILIVLAYFVYLGFKSHSGSANGLVNKKLSPCPNKPNCVCSEFANKKRPEINGIKYTELNLKKIEEAIKITGGKITTIKENYIAATYTSSLFRYVDDFEIRIDAEKKIIHFRSASRVGHSDMGANQKRIEAFKKALAKL